MYDSCLAHLYKLMVYILGVLYILQISFPIPDVDECADDIDNCHANADCTDNIGSFSCMCSSGYSGDGVENCTGEEAALYRTPSSDTSKLNYPILHSQTLMNVLLGPTCVMSMQTVRTP